MARTKSQFRIRRISTRLHRFARHAYHGHRLLAQAFVAASATVFVGVAVLGFELRAAYLASDLNSAADSVAVLDIETADLLGRAEDALAGRRSSDSGRITLGEAPTEPAAVANQDEVLLAIQTEIQAKLESLKADYKNLKVEEQLYCSTNSNS